MNTGAAAKAVMRDVALAARAVAHAAGQGAASDHLRTELAPWHGKVLAGYMPMRSEIDPLPAMSDWAGPVCVPVVVERAAPLRFRRWTPEARMVPGNFGALIPESGDWLVPEVLIVPLVAFDRRGGRLGYGGGFYDRTLQALRAHGPVAAIGFAFAAQEVPDVPTEPTDQPLDLIVTESGRIAFP